MSAANPIQPDPIPALILAVDQADSAPALLEAVQNLAATAAIAAIPTLIAALGYNNPGAAVAAVDGLIAIGVPAVPPLLVLLDQYNYSARAWAIRALAGIGDPRALETLLDSAQTDMALSVRRAAARGLGIVRWQEIPETDRLAIQETCLRTLCVVSQDPEWIVRYAAVTGLEQLSIALAIPQTEAALQILAHFDQMVKSEDCLAVIARIFRAQQALLSFVQDSLQEQGSPSLGALVSTMDLDWQAVVQKLYAQKSQTQPLQAGDPRLFQKTAADLIPNIPVCKSL